MEQLRQLGSFIADLKFSDVPENVRQAALLHVLDTVGAAVGGAGEAQAGRIREKWLAMNPAGQNSVWGSGQKTAAGPAAFLNAMAGHTLEMDDVHTRSKTHIGTVVVPAAWAAAEYGKKSGPAHILTADDGGILKMMSDQPRPELVAASLGSVWETLYVDNKPYPSCRSTHCAIDGALALREEGQIPVEEIEQVEVETYQVGYKQCGFSDSSLHPQKPVQAKFSTPFTVACALLFGEFTLRQRNRYMKRHCP